MATVDKQTCFPPPPKTPLLELLYFDIAGKGEMMRLLCAFGSLSLKDTRFKSYDEFLAMKASGKLSFGQVPLLKVSDGSGGTVDLVQSAAIMRYLGKRTGTYPKDILEAAKVDAIIDQEADAFMGVRVTRYKGRFGFKEEYLSDETWSKVEETINSEIVPGHLARLEKVLKKSTSGWLASTSGPSIADFFWVPTLKSIQGGWTGNADALKPFPALEKLITKFDEIPAVKAYYSSKV